MKAKAVVFMDMLAMDFRDITVPEPGPRDVVVETQYSWISNGTERSFLRGERIHAEIPYQPGHPWPFPCVPGYQSTGIVQRVGDQVTDITAGQRVFCTVGRVDGMYEPFGGHASVKVCDRAQVWPLPQTVSPLAASALVLAQTGYNCATRAPLRAGNCAVIVGDGLVGHFVAQMMLLRGAGVIMVGRHDERLGLFAETERSRRVNMKVQEPVEALRQLAPSGIHVLVDAVGTLSAIQPFLPLMRQGAHIISAGFHGLDSLLNIQKLRLRELTLHSPSGWNQHRMDQTLALLANGRINPEALITHQFAAEKIVDAWRLILERKEGVLGVVLKWT